MSRNQRLRLGLFCALLANLSGCSMARIVSCNPSDAVVAIPNNSDNWPYYHRQHAEEAMRAKFPQGYVIEKEEEVVVGTTQVTQTNTERTGDPLLAALRIAPVVEHANQTTSSLDRKEWRIFFHKADGDQVSGESLR